MPAEPADERARQRVEGADERGVVHRPFPSAMQARFHRKAFGYDVNLTKSTEETAELAGAELEEHRRVLVLEADPGATADVENRSTAIAVKVHQPNQMMQLLEVVPVEVVEEPTRSRRFVRHLEIVDMGVPVRANLVNRRHAENYIGCPR